MGVMAWGMWRARYWAVLGFQMLLVLPDLRRRRSAWCWPATAAPGRRHALVLRVGLGTLFYFMVKAMARIQMPAPARAAR